MDPINRDILIVMLTVGVLPGALMGVITGVVHAIDCLAKFIKEELHATSRE